MRNLIFSILALALFGVAGSADAQTSVSADITADATWSGVVVLENPVFVRNGATLTILPGTIVRGQPRTSAVTPGSTVGTPGALIVTRTGRLIAEGSAGNPIVMTTAAVDNVAPFGVPDDVDANGFNDAWTAGDAFLDSDPTGAPLAPLNAAGGANVALWGGLVVLGNAPTNLGTGCGTSPTEGSCTVEGLTVPGFDPANATYGGTVVHDNSGRLRYVSVRHAGDEIGSGNELNGITLAGVGDGTTFENIEVYCNFDDGIEWFGGTVNGKNLHVAFAGDDAFDLDQGYTGVNQFLYGVMPFFNQDNASSFGSASGDKAGEWDGDDFDEPGSNVNLNSDGAPQPFSYPVMLNVTIIGSTTSVANPAVSPASDNRGIQMRNGFGGELRNSVVVNTGSSQGFDISGGGPAGATTTDNISADLIRVVSSTFDDGAALPADELAALANGDAVNGGPGANVVNSPSFPGLVNEAITFDPKGASAGVAGKLEAGDKTGGLINPRVAFGLTGTAGGLPATEPGANSAAVYRGAFDPSAAVPLWTNGWTALDQAGFY